MRTPRRTAFAGDGSDPVTAAHVLAQQMLADCPAIPVAPVKATEVCRHEHVDVGRMKVDHRVPVYLSLGDSKRVKVGDPIRVPGHPSMFRRARSRNISPWIGVPQFVVDCPIVRGNSSGPVLNASIEVIGIAVKGQGLPGRAGDDDALSRFVPIDFALDYLKG